MCKFSVFHCYCGHILYRFRDKADIGRRSRLFVPLRNNPRERTVPNRFRSLAYLVVHLNSAKVFVYSRTNRETDGKAVSIAERLLYRNARYKFVNVTLRNGVCGTLRWCLQTDRSISVWTHKSLSFVLVRLAQCERNRRSGEQQIVALYVRCGASLRVA